MIRFEFRRRGTSLAAACVGGHASQQSLVDGNVVQGHACGRKTLLKPAANGGTIKGEDTGHRSHRLLERVDEQTGDEATAAMTPLKS
jgi:hypothetical protein